MSYEVVRRTAEIGIRRALGAPTAAVLRLVIGRTTRLVALGAAGGLAGALAVTRALRTFLFGVEPFDPATFAMVAGALVAVAVVASAIPARRAALVDPTVALRSE
jgi:ABC-type antimicrobial peptide transport system permease subunit